MEVVFETRFSYFGKSGWRSKAAADPALLFHPDRLAHRLALFEQVTLASLRDQSDDDFSLLVLSSELMPVEWQERLRAVLERTIGADRSQLVFRPAGNAGLDLRAEIRNAYHVQDVAQVVLDDDDAVAVDFVATVRAQAQALKAERRHPDDYGFLSFPQGYSIGFEEGRAAWMAERFVPFTNLGLTLVARGVTDKNPFLTSHRKIGERHPSRVINSQRPYYLRAVHGHNDSRAIARGDRLTDAEIRAAFAYFPFLRAHFVPQAVDGGRGSEPDRGDKPAGGADAATQAGMP